MFMSISQLENQLEKLQYKLDHYDLSIREIEKIKFQIKNLECEIRFEKQCKDNDVPKEWKLKL